MAAKAAGKRRPRQELCRQPCVHEIAVEIRYPKYDTQKTAPGPVTEDAWRQTNIYTCARGRHKKQEKASQKLDRTSSLFVIFGNKFSDACLSVTHARATLHKQSRTHVHTHPPLHDSEPHTSTTPYQYLLPRTIIDIAFTRTALQWGEKILCCNKTLDVKHTEGKLVFAHTHLSSNTFARAPAPRGAETEAHSWEALTHAELCMSSEKEEIHDISRGAYSFTVASTHRCCLPYL
jgi:hypothetical protein